MKCILKLIDNEFPYTYIDNIRYISRGILINDKNEVALNKLHGFDMFGSRDYYETPGGGKKDNETQEEALYREMKEETGYEVEIIEELGMVDDYYNLIHRNNKNHYYLCKPLRFIGKSLEDYETIMIERLEWIDLDKAIEIFKNMNISPVSRLVRNRELPILLKVKEIMEAR